MTVPEIPGRQNALGCTSEVWKPPVFSGTGTFSGRILAFVRRLLDLQAASLWIDLSVVLKQLSGTVVDVGCGAQPYRNLLKPDVRYVGIDTHTAGLQFGYQTPDTLYYDGVKFPVADGEVDAVMATETLEHVADTGQFLGEIFRVLKPDGICVLTVPFAARWHYIPWDYYRFTPSGLKLILEQAGFCDLIIYARGNSVTVAAYKVMAVVLALVLGHFQNPISTVFARLTGTMLLPVLAVAALFGQVSLRFQGGDDCLGYTVIGRRG
jgi:SAM-dependent methyltransferase